MEELVQITRLKRADYIDLIRAARDRSARKQFEPQLPVDRLSKSWDQSKTAAAAGPIPECTTCGVCCICFAMVPVTRHEVKRLREYWEIVHEVSDTVIERVLPRSEMGSCKHLAGDLGKSLSCGIYADRPNVCRVFEAGSDRCHEMRRVYGLEPQLSEEELDVELVKFPPVERNEIAVTMIEEVSATHWTKFGPDGSISDSGTDHEMCIWAYLDEDRETAHAVHRYRASEETWFESEFLGLTLDQAKKLIGKEQGLIAENVKESGNSRIAGKGEDGQ